LLQKEIEMAIKANLDFFRLDYFLMLYMKAATQIKTGLKRKEGIYANI